MCARLVFVCFVVCRGVAPWPRGHAMRRFLICSIVLARVLACVPSPSLCGCACVASLSGGVLGPGHWCHMQW